MSNTVPVLARWLHTIALALWMGGLIAIGALVAPVAFHLVQINPVLGGNPSAQAALAGGIVGDSLRRFNVVCYACGGLLLLANGLLLARAGLSRRHRVWTALALLVTLALAASALYLGLGLFPAMDSAQAQSNRTLFDTLHARYERVSTHLQFPLLLALALLSALRDTPALTVAPKSQTGTAAQERQSDERLA